MALPQEHSRVHDRAIVGVLTRRWRMNSLSFHTSVPSNQPLATASQLCFIFMVSLPHHRSWNHACLPDIDVMLTYMPDSQSATNTCVFFVLLRYRGCEKFRECLSFLGRIVSCVLFFRLFGSVCWFSLEMVFGTDLCHAHQVIG
jgi:hypothetical protein